MFAPSGIRKKMIFSYLVTILILGLTSVFSYYNARVVLDRLKEMVSDHVYLNELSNDAHALVIEVEKYLSTKSSDTLLNYYTLYNALESKAGSISRETTYDQDELMLKNIGYMIDCLLQEADLAVKAKRGRIGSEYVAHFTRVMEIDDHITSYVNNLLHRRLLEGSEQYAVINKNMTYLSYLNILVIVLSVLFNIFLALLFAHRLTKPIVELAHAADKVAAGNFDVKPVVREADDEINILAKAFNKMTANIKSYIDEIKKQAEIEAKLKKQEMENLQMKNLLKDAELKSLQSQINPHFLFNTLNTASQLAMMEGADQSSEFIENVAQLYRYNLRKLDEPITLEEEIDHVIKYMYIIQVRFGDRVAFHTEVDSKLLDLKVPCTIIQPIVENAFIHGLSDLDTNGTISLVVRGDDKTIFIDVIDNGVGMDEAGIKTLLAGIDPDMTSRQVTGLGVYNVVNRLKLFYNIEDSRDIIEIESKPGRGTKVTLKIPRAKGRSGHD
ncbi:MAG: histidine kinase [Dethiobacteria bacterium]|jgi:sensor histidine kinase YesM